MLALADFAAVSAGSALTHASDMSTASAVIAAAASHGNADATADLTFLEFHIQQSRLLQLSDTVNSYCLPVYAVPLTAAKLREASALTSAEKALSQRKHQSAARRALEASTGTRRYTARTPSTPAVKRRRRQPAQRRESTQEETERMQRRREREYETPARAADADEPHESYTTRSGRTTRKRVETGEDGEEAADDDDDDEDEEAFKEEDLEEEDDDDEEEADDVELDDDDMEGDDDDDDGGSAKKKRRRASSPSGGGTPGGYASAYADMVGTFSFTKKSVVAGPGAEGVRVDANGVVTAVPEGAGEDAPRVGDVLSKRDEAGADPQAWIAGQVRTGRGVEFEGKRERYIGKLHGMKGMLIHPTQLFEAVQELGGFEDVKDKHLWQHVRRKLNLAGTSSSGFALRRAFENYFVT